MLKSLSIRNVVLIEKLDIDFSEGFSIFSGETGAGKSILLDSIGLILGNRADIGLIRNGQDKLTVSAVFEIKDKSNPFFDICADNDIDTDNEIIIKRSVSKDGKSKIFLNDQPITQRLLKELGMYLVEIHGQFDNQGLLNPATHLSVVDNFADYKNELNQVSEAYQKYKTLVKELEYAKSEFVKNSEDEDTIKHWIKELEALNIKVGEFDELNKKRIEAINAEKIIENLNTAYSYLHGNDIVSMIQKAHTALCRANNLTENSFEDISELLNDTLINVDEAINRIVQSSQDINHNSNEAEMIQERLFTLRNLARKHQCEVDDLPSVLENFYVKITSINKGEEQIAELNEKVAQAKEDYIKKASVLHQLRIEAATKLDLLVAKELPPLKMERATFKTNVESLEENSWSVNGMDNVYFSVATNTDSLQGPLNKIASGGELSRFMLALKVNLAQKGSTETLVFDEIDTGIGGATAQAVGERLARLSNNVQVLVVTHSPQVAAFGKEHFYVSKSVNNDTTTTSVKSLSKKEKQEEIARMLSGDKITDEARAAAESLIIRSYR